MKKNLTEIVFILDCSGSMNGLEGDTIGGAIHHIGNVHKYARPEDVPEHTLFVITTDGLYSGAICSPFPAKPCGFVPGSKIFTEIPRRHPRPVGFTAARFAPRSSQSLAAPFRGAKSSHRFRAAACLRRPFPRRDLLPAPRKALKLRFGEQNLHRNSAPPPASGRLSSGAICTPPPAKT